MKDLDCKEVRIQKRRWDFCNLQSLKKRKAKIANKSFKDDAVANGNCACSACKFSP